MYEGAQIDRYHVIESSTGNTLCELESSAFSLYSSAISPDEKRIALPLSGQWQVRDLKTGQLLRALPLVPNTVSGAFSPDGNTLYSVADGVLYRQRAR